jgi:hypothetical protein
VLDGPESSAYVMNFILAALLATQCAAVDRCQLARSIEQYARSRDKGHELQRLLDESPDPCLGICGNDEMVDPFYRSVEVLVPAIQTRLKAGDQVAWTIAVSLLEFTDGGLWEDLSAMIDRSVSVQPRAFLRAAKARPRSGALEALDFMGEEFVDKPVSKRCRAIRQRLNAIRSVGDLALVEVRDQAVALLQKSIDQCG